MQNDHAAPPSHRPSSKLTRLFRTAVAPLVIAAALGGATLLAPATAAAQTKIAVIDVRRAIFETEDGLRAQATLKKLFDSRQVELDTQQRALTEEQKKLEKEAQAGKTPKEALQKRRETWQRQAAEFQSKLVDYQKEMQRTEGELTKRIYDKVVLIVRRMAAREGYELVVEKSALPYFRADLEVTDRVIQAYNSGQDSGSKPAAPRKPATPAKKAPSRKH